MNSMNVYRLRQHGRTETYVHMHKTPLTHTHTHTHTVTLVLCKQNPAIHMLPAGKEAHTITYSI